MDVAALARHLITEAEYTDHRRLLTLAGDRDRGYAVADTALTAADIPRAETVLIGPDDRLDCERLAPSQTGDLLGRTQQAVVVDAHATARPNTIGRAVGAVDGGGLLVMLTPPLSQWPNQRDQFDQRLAVPPYESSDLTGHFRERLRNTLQRHPGVAIVDVDADCIHADGRTHPAPQRDPIRTAPSVPSERSFPAAAYKRCRTPDQRDALATLEALETESAIVVLESDRGRGKSSVCGLAAGVLAERGESVSIVASSPQNVTELFDRAKEVLTDRDALVAREGSPPRLDTDSGGAIVYRPPGEAGMLDGPTIVDEAASLPVQTLEAALAADCVAFATTIHGYEGAGRGFSVRFMERLDPLDPTVVRLETPIRYAPADPIELWAFDALLLNARPAVDQVVAGGTPQYRRLTPTDLMDDEILLREVFGLLVLAHYRTEPDDLARLLDAPNLAVRALTVDGHVLAVALLAREGGLSATRRAALYEGGRIRGHMIPDVLTSQLRDELAAAPTGARVLRIATHPARRDEGIGSRLLAEIRAEAHEGIPEWADRTDAIDWLGVGFGATPRLVRFWRQNGFSTVHFSTTRNERSGEHSAVMLDPLTAAGNRLRRKVTRRFARRISAVGPASLTAVDTDVLRAALRGIDPTPLAPPTLTDWEWEVVAGVAFGPGLVDVAPRPFAQLAIRYFAETNAPVAQGPPEGWSNITGTDALNEEAERALVGRLLQGRPWSNVRKDGEGGSPSHTKRMLGNAVAPLARRYGGSIVDRLEVRFTDE